MKRPDIETAIRVYYENPEIGNEEIRLLFGEVSRSTAAKYKGMVSEVMAERGVKTFRPYSVNTEIAYEVWGFDIRDLEQRRKKLVSLGMCQNQ